MNGQQFDELRFQRRIEGTAQNALRKQIENFQAVTSGFVEQFQSLQAAREAFLLPSDYLRFFEGIDNEVEKQWFWGLHRDTLQVAMKAREWQKQRDAAQRVQDEQIKEGVGGYSALLGAITDPGEKNRFLTKYKAEIEAEVRDTQDRIRLAKSAPATTL
jgi:hypothetical protein